MNAAAGNMIIASRLAYVFSLLHLRSSDAMCVYVCESVRQEFEGLAIISCFGSVFLGGGCIFCIYKQLLIHQHLLTVLSRSGVNSMRVYGNGCVCVRSWAELLVCRVSLNMQSFHKTDLSRAVGGPNRFAQTSKWICNVKVYDALAPVWVCISVCMCVCVWARSNVHCISNFSDSMISLYLPHRSALQSSSVCSCAGLVTATSG